MKTIASNLRIARAASSRTDIVLNRIEELIDTYNGLMEDYRCLSQLADLFFTTDYWLKYYQSNRGYEAGQAQIVLKLYGDIVDLLCTAFGCTVNVLPKHLELMFGRTLTEIGGDVDIVQGFARFADPGETAQYKLRFKDGLAFQYPWWLGGRWSDGALVRAESRRAEAKVHGANQGGDMPNWGNSVMSMNREIYMAKHVLGSTDGKGIYHSFYLPNSAVMFAGSMLITGGGVIGVCPNSGHFKPTENNTLALLQALAMFSIPLEPLGVFDHYGRFQNFALDFMRTYERGKNLVDNMNESLRLNQEAAWANTQHPYVQKWVMKRMEAMAFRVKIPDPVASVGTAPPLGLPNSANTGAEDVVMDLDEEINYNQQNLNYNA